MTTFKAILAAVVALLLATVAPVGAINEASFLREAANALAEGDHVRYDQLTSMLVENPEVPGTVQQALTTHTKEIISLGAELIDLHNAELYQRAIDTLEREQSILPPPNQGANGPASPPVLPDGLETARSIDLEGLTILQLLDIRELDVPDSAREVLGLMPRPESNERGPRPVTFEMARRELQEILPTTTPSPWSQWAPVVVGAIAAGLLAAVWTRSRRITKLTALAATDGLTGLNNRRQLDLDLGAESKRGATPTALLMIDIDHFTQFNFAHGHTVGDEALRQVARAITAGVRQGDVCYRYGGEEFCVLLPGTDEATAAGIARRVRECIEAVVINGSNVTASVGVASGKAVDVSDTTVKADKALYAAKESGRNQVALASRTLR